MAATLETTIKRFIGSSFDDKPLAVPAGSSFLETDTGKIHRFDGTLWAHAEGVDEQQLTLQLVLVELTQIRELLTLATS